MLAPIITAAHNDLDLPVGIARPLRGSFMAVSFDYFRKKGGMVEAGIKSRQNRAGIGLRWLRKSNGRSNRPLFRVVILHFQ